jgi:hypothetical protein
MGHVFEYSGAEMTDTLQDRLNLPATRKIVLLRIVIGQHLFHWTNDLTYTNTWYSATDEFLEGCRENGTDMASTASLASLDVADTSGGGKFYWDQSAGRLYVKPLSTLTDPTDATYLAMIVLPVSEQGKEFESEFYDPRLIGTPSVKQDVSPQFDKLGTVGGGSFSLANADGEYDSRSHYDWAAGYVEAKLGADRMT